jgi:O-antigen/teichoic acid export membrane protein
LIQNIIANILGRSSSVILSIIFTPLIISKLGFESYGIIAFANIIIALTSLIDLGFSISLNRSIAAHSENISENIFIATLIKNYESFFLVCFGFVILIGILFGFLIQESFLNSNSYSSLYLYMCVVVIFFNSAIRLPINTFSAVYLGLEKHVFVNVFLFIFAFMRIVVALSISAYYSDVIVFFSIQCLISLFEYFFFKFSVNKLTSYLKNANSFSFQKFMPEIKNSINIGFVTILALLISQYDKVLFSSFLSLHEFGKYGVVAMIASGIISLGYPIATSLFPRMTKFINEPQNLFNTFNFGLSLLMLILLPIVSLLFFYSSSILKIYLGNDDLRGIYSFYLSILSIFAIFSGMRPLISNYFFACKNENELKRYYLYFSFFYIILLPIALFKVDFVMAIVIMTIMHSVFFIYLYIKCMLKMKRPIAINFFKFLLVPTIAVFIFSKYMSTIFIDPNLYELVFIFTINLIVLFIFFFSTFKSYLYEYEQ